MATKANTSSAPSHKIRGYEVTASIFQRDITTKDGKQTTVYNISLTRPYTDEEGKRKYTANLRYADLLDASKVLEQTFVYLTAKKHRVSDDNQSGE